MPRPEAGERRSAEPVKYRGAGKPVGFNSLPGYQAGTQAGKVGAAWLGQLQQRYKQLQATQANWDDRMRLQQQQRVAAWEKDQGNLEADAQDALARSLYYNKPSERTMTRIGNGDRTYYEGAGSMGGMYAQQGRGNQARAAQPRGRAQAAPLPLFSANGNYNGAGSMANMYAAQGREYDINASKWSSLRKQQAAYHSTLDQNTSQGAYYFGPGSAEQLYATAAYANAPINMPVVPVDYYGGGGGYGYGGGYGGGSSYVAPEPDIPRWLYGMLSWRYR